MSGVALFLLVAYVVVTGVEYIYGLGETSGRDKAELANMKNDLECYESSVTLQNRGDGQGTIYHYYYPNKFNKEDAK